MSHPQLDLSNDELLTTTRAVRKRLDFDREVPVSVLEDWSAAERESNSRNPMESP